jgi:uncharacterized phage protein (TIGR02218 family)
MKSYSSTFLATLNAQTKFLAYCWQLTLNDGTILGFTDFDRPLTIAGVVYQPDGGFRPSDFDRDLNNSADQITLQSYFSSQLPESVITSGQLRGARVFIFQVDPLNLPSSLDDNPLTYNPLSRGTIEQVTRTDQSFQATAQGLKSRLSNRQGWVMSPTCRNQFCDQLCGLNISSYTDTVEISAPGSNNYSFTSNLSFSDNYYTGGKIIFIDGTNQGFETTVTYSNGSNIRCLDAPPNPLQTGYHATVQRACDKTFETCVAKFGNGTKFNGEVGLPGDNVLGNSTQVTP